MKYFKSTKGLSKDYLIDKVLNKQYKELLRDTDSLSNTSKYIEIDNTIYVLRTNSEINNIVTDRNNEILCTEKLYKRKLTPWTIYFDNYKLSLYYNDNNSTPNIKDHVALLSKLHKSNISSAFDCESLVDSYGKYSDYPELSNKLCCSYHLISNQVVSYPVFCHMDAIKNNMICNKYLIDFEYSGMYYKEFDLASLIIDYNLNDSQILDLIDYYCTYNSIYRYYDLIRAGVKSSVNLCYTMLNILWFSWGIAYYKFYNDDKFLKEAYSYYKNTVSSYNSTVLHNQYQIDIIDIMRKLLHNIEGDKINE